MKHHKLFWGSSYDRGLDVLLQIWGDIIAKFPDATLNVCYGWDLFDVATANNPERQHWKSIVVELLKQPGVTEHGRIGKEELKKVREQCGVWAYPTYFEEINCITALECQNDGLVPVTTALGALNETARHGILIPLEIGNAKGGINNPTILKEFQKQLLELMGDKERWDQMSYKCQKFARKFDWTRISSDWKPILDAKAEYTTKVTVFTPTIREGWWNLMAKNLSTQSYKIHEWIIVDDHKDDRSEIAKKYAEKYNLNIVYLKGKERKTKRTYSLVNANNTALESCTGDLFVFLQDFIVLQPEAIEELVRESARHPGDFIAPVDAYYSPKIKPNTANKEDWFDGETDVVGEFMRKNVRFQGKSVRVGSAVTDFEHNFGAVPVKTLKRLGGYYEFFDESLGFDNTEIIFRAWQLGYRVWIDEWNIAICIDHWGTVGSTEGGVNRTRRLNDPRFVWMQEQILNQKLPIVRTQEIDDGIDLQYTIPEEIPDDKCVEWMREHMKEIVGGWK